MEGKTHRLSVNYARDLEGQVSFHLSKSLFEPPSFCRPRTIVSLSKRLVWKRPRDPKRSTIGSLSMAGTLKIAN